jgi:hypothetical protein
LSLIFASSSSLAWTGGGVAYVFSIGCR